MNNDLDIRKLFENWVEPEIAHYYVGCLLGIMKFDTSQETWLSVKAACLVNGGANRALFPILEACVDSGMLVNNEDAQYKWNKEFDQHIYWDKDNPRQ